MGICAKREPTKVASCQTLAVFRRVESYRFCKSEYTRDSEHLGNIRKGYTDPNRHMVHISCVFAAVRPRGDRYRQPISLKDMGGVHTSSTSRSKPAPRNVLAVYHAEPSGRLTYSGASLGSTNGKNIKQSKAKLIIGGSCKGDMVVVVQV